MQLRLQVLAKQKILNFFQQFLTFLAICCSGFSSIIGMLNISSGTAVFYGNQRGFAAVAGSELGFVALSGRQVFKKI